MRLINARFLFSPRKVVNLVVILVTAIIIVNFVMISLNEKHRRPRRILNRAEDPRLFTKLKSNISCKAKVKVLVLVSSNLGHSDRRTLIRNTWGPDSSFGNRWRTVFLLTGNDNKREQQISETENKIYGDIITGDYKESFFNMAFKVAMGFEWGLKFCNFDYLLKTDDDIFVNTYGLLEYLDKNSTLKTKLYTGNPMIGSPVLREGRYAVKYATGEKRDDATNKTMFSPYCSGGGFLLSKDVVASILNLFDLEHPLNIDDAYIGELAERATVKLLINSKNFLMYEDKCRYKPQAFVQHPARGDCLRELHRQHVKYLLTGELETPKPTKPPTKAPTQPPAKAPAKPPAKAPTQPPAKAPTQPPAKAPTQPPAMTPTQPRTKAPTQPPAMAPTQPPAKAPAKPPTMAPTQPPAKAPTQPPAKAATQPPAKAPTQPPTKPSVKVPEKVDGQNQKDGVKPQGKAKDTPQQQPQGNITPTVLGQVAKPNPVALADQKQEAPKVPGQAATPKLQIIAGTNPTSRVLQTLKARDTSE